jgi:hypothetical protein
MQGTNAFLNPVVGLALDELRERSKAKIHQTDPECWLSDVLGKRWWSKQREIVFEGFLPNRRVGVKSGNGVGKSALLADLVTWWVSVFPPEEVLAIITAPTLSQIEKVIFAYLKANYGLARSRGFGLRGEISEELSWRWVNPLSGKKDFLAFGKRPADRDIVSSFQGTRAFRTFVGLDEAGGVPGELFTAAEAVTTGEESRFLAIGNPDRRGTAFNDLWVRPELSAEWWLGTISVFDLPTFTGEVVYDDEVVEERFRRSLTSVEWVEHKRRTWGEGDARWLAKVLGSFRVRVMIRFLVSRCWIRRMTLTLLRTGRLGPFWALMLRGLVRMSRWWWLIGVVVVVWWVRGGRRTL